MLIVALLNYCFNFLGFFMFLPIFVLSFLQGFCIFFIIILSMFVLNSRLFSFNSSNVLFMFECFSFMFQGFSSLFTSSGVLFILDCFHSLVQWFSSKLFGFVYVRKVSLHA